MSKRPPKTVALNHDGHSAAYVGRTTAGRQFFLTTPFVPKMGADEGHEFIALYVFDKAGVLVSATIDDLGPRETMDETARTLRRDAMLASLGKVKYQRIKVSPFRIEMFGVEFGFLAEPYDDGTGYNVTVEPGDYMSFDAPWDSGDYDT